MSTNDQASVVVTGLGATTPLGGDVASTWSAMLAGTSGVRRLTDDWVNTLPVYATQYHTVVVQPASTQYETIPAEYEDVTRTVMVTRPSVRHEVIPAVFGSQSALVIQGLGCSGHVVIDI